MFRTVSLLVSFLITQLAFSSVDFGAVVWEYETGDSVSSSPTLDSSGNVYFGSLDGYVYSVNGDGSLRWRHDSGDLLDSSPVLSRDEEAVYIGSWRDRLIALNAATGALLWSFDTGSLVYASPAVAEDGTIYFGSSDGYFYALNPDGSLKWEFQLGGELDSSPAIDAVGNIYVGSSLGLVSCLSPAGVELWAWEVPTEVGSSGRDFGIVSSPMLTAEGDVIFGSQNYFIYALDAATGTLRWKHETGGIVEGSVVEGMGRSCIVGGRDGYLYSISWDGTLNWKAFVGANYYSTPCVDGMGRIYAGVLRGTLEGSLLVLSSEGDVLWRSDFSSFVDSSPLLGPDGTVYVGNNNGRLYALAGGDKLASLGWSSFRGGASQRRSIQGYVDLTATAGRLRAVSQDFDETDSVSGSYELEGGGPVKVEIRGLGSGLERSEGATEYSLRLIGTSGEMAFVEAFVPLDGGFDGSIHGWLEPGAYRIVASNESSDREAFFVEVKVK